LRAEHLIFEGFGKFLKLGVNRKFNHRLQINFLLNMKETISENYFLSGSDLINSVSIKVKSKNKINSSSVIDNMIKQKKFANDNFDCTREISLWKAVILQSLVDLKSQSKKKMAKVNRVKSILWLNLQNRDFLLACSYAELDPLYVWEKAQIIKKNNPMI
jgi:hypothetical protein